MAAGVRYRLSFILFLFGLVVLARANALAAGGSFVVDDYATNEVGQCNVESWYSMARNKDFILTAAPACVVNLGIPVEFGGQIQRARSGNETSSIGSAGSKVTVLPLTHGFGIALSGQANWNIVSGASTGGNINVPITFDGGRYRIHLNGGWIYDATAGKNYGSWGLAGEYDITPRLQGIAEVFGQSTAHPPATHTNSPRAQIGVRYTPIDSLDLDLIYGHNIAGENSQWITLGFNIRFGGSEHPAYIHRR